MDKQSWSVNVPLNDIIALLGAMDELERVTADNKQLRREVDGLRRMQNDTIEALGDLRSQLRKAVG